MGKRKKRAAGKLSNGNGRERMQPQYKRVLLKLSGEAMAGDAKSGLDFDTVLRICAAVSYTHLSFIVRLASTIREFSGMSGRLMNFK